MGSLETHKLAIKMYDKHEIKKKNVTLKAFSSTIYNEIKKKEIDEEIAMFTRKFC